MQAADGIKAPPALKARLRKLGLVSNNDLVLHLPLRYEDETQLALIASALSDRPVQVEAEVLEVSVQFRPRRQLVVRVADCSGELTLRFLNFSGSQRAISGKIMMSTMVTNISAENGMMEA